MTHVVIHTTLIATTTVVLFLLWVIIAVTVHNKDMKNLEEINSSNKTATVYIVRHGEKTYGTQGLRSHSLLFCQYTTCYRWMMVPFPSCNFFSPTFFLPQF